MSRQTELDEAARNLWHIQCEVWRGKVTHEVLEEANSAYLSLLLNKKCTQ